MAVKIKRLVSVQISCRTCRKNKSAQVCESRCKYRDGGARDTYRDMPCVEWLPSKRDIKIWLAR